MNSNLYDAIPGFVFAGVWTLVSIVAPLLLIARRKPISPPWYAVFVGISLGAIVNAALWLGDALTKLSGWN